MAILVYFRGDNPNNVIVFPPTITASDWQEKTRKYIRTKTGQDDWSDIHFILDNMDELNNFVRDYKLTDEILLNDLAVWKAAHGITYTGGFYDLSPGGGLIRSVDHVLPVDTVAVDTSLI